MHVLYGMKTYLRPLKKKHPINQPKTILFLFKINQFHTSKLKYSPAAVKSIRVFKAFFFNVCSNLSKPPLGRLESRKSMQQTLVSTVRTAKSSSIQLFSEETCLFLLQSKQTPLALKGHYWLYRETRVRFIKRYIHIILKTLPCALYPSSSTAAGSGCSGYPDFFFFFAKAQISHYGPSSSSSPSTTAVRNLSVFV